MKLSHTPVFFIFYILCIIGSSLAAQAKIGSVQAFVIDSGKRDTVSVKLEGEAVSTGCFLKYDTSAEDSSKKKEYTPAPELIAQMSKKYGCLKYKHDIFDYEICLENEITQKAGVDKYSLGSYEKLSEGHTFSQIYTKGTYCEAAHIERKTTLEFSCGDKGSVISISEHATCQYKINIGAPEVCGHPQFSVVSDKAEAWVLEISETDEGAIICQAYNNGYDNIGLVTFSTFQLSLTTQDYSLIKHTVRTKNRKLADSSSLKKSTTPAGIAIGKSMQVDYAKVVAE